VVFSDLNLDIYKGDRIAFVGKNGCGKTTLTKIINGELECQGKYKKGEKVIINYFAQNQNELLDPDISIIQHIEGISSEKSSTQLRSLLGSFLFTGESVNKKIKVLSGGEKARLSLCASLLTPSNLIILDEPTNHLDIFAKDILKQALLQYDGTLVIVSHDRRFLSGLTDRVIEFTDNGVREFPGNIDSYLDEKATIKDIVIKAKKETKNNYKEKKEYDKRLRFLNKQNHKLESVITEIESEIKAFNNSLKHISKGQAVNYNDYNKLNDKLNEQLVKWEEVQFQIEKHKEK